jgi:hypothetical protein
MMHTGVPHGDGWASMTFDGVLPRGTDLLQRRGRVSYRALKW